MQPDLTFQSASLRLAGTLTGVTSGRRPSAVALLVSGSGPIDRDSNMKRQSIDVMRHLARHLEGAGINSFRYDKRGVGSSDGEYHASGFHDNVADAAAAITMLRSRSDVDPKSVFVVGHSEGALIATELAATDPDLAGIVLLAGTAVPGETVLQWQAERISATLPAPVKLILRLLRQDVVGKQAKQLAKIRASTTDTMRLQLAKINAKWFREFLDHDPGASLGAIGCPVLALTGSKDIQVNPDDVEQICRSVAADCTGMVVPDVTHLLRREAGPPSIRTYKKQAKRPLDQTILDTVGQWIGERAGQPARDRQARNDT